MDMKLRGMYIARQLSFQGIVFDTYFYNVSKRKKEYSIDKFYLKLNLFDFTGVGFRIDEVELPEKMKNIYNKSVELWVELLHKFEEAAELISAEKKMRKTMWGQYWSSHQRFFSNPGGLHQ